jgi:hypothetical protein
MITTLATSILWLLPIFILVRLSLVALCCRFRLVLIISLLLVLSLLTIFPWLMIEVGHISLLTSTSSLSIVSASSSRISYLTISLLSYSPYSLGLITSVLTLLLFSIINSFAITSAATTPLSSDIISISSITTTSTVLTFC